jgi:hypothetical protein
MVEEAGEHVAILAPDASAALLFANAPLTRRLLGADPYGEEEAEAVDDVEEEEEEEEEAAAAIGGSGSEGEEELLKPRGQRPDRQQRRLQQLLGK